MQPPYALLLCTHAQLVVVIDWAYDTCTWMAISTTIAVITITDRDILAYQTYAKMRPMAEVDRRQYLRDTGLHDARCRQVGKSSRLQEFIGQAVLKAHR